MRGTEVIIGLVWLANLVATVDALRRPKHASVAADHDRGFCLGLAEFRRPG